jgi:hypothetical protein
MIFQSWDRSRSSFDDRRNWDDLVGVAVVVAGSFAAWGLWIAEVIWLKGWAGLAWLSSFNWSFFPICAVILATSSYLVAPRVGWRNRIAFVGLGFILAIAAVVAARWATFELFSEAMPSQLWVTPTIVLVMSWVIVAVGLSMLANRYLASLHIWTAPLLVVGLILVLPLSFATIRMLPALNGSTDELHSIKMGYPVFWAALIVPLALRIGRKTKRVQHQQGTTT